MAASTQERVALETARQYGGDGDNPPTDNWSIAEPWSMTVSPKPSPPPAPGPEQSFEASEYAPPPTPTPGFPGARVSIPPQLGLGTTPWNPADEGAKPAVPAAAWSPASEGAKPGAPPTAQTKGAWSPGDEGAKPGAAPAPPAAAAQAWTPGDEGAVSMLPTGQQEVDTSDLEQKSLREQINGIYDRTTQNPDINAYQSAHILYPKLQAQGAQPVKLADDITGTLTGLVKGTLGVPAGIASLINTLGSSGRTVINALGGSPFDDVEQDLREKLANDPQALEAGLMKLNQARELRERMTAMGPPLQQRVEMENQIASLVAQANPSFAKNHVQQALLEAIHGGKLSAQEIAKFLDTLYGPTAWNPMDYFLPSALSKMSEGELGDYLARQQKQDVALAASKKGQLSPIEQSTANSINNFFGRPVLTNDQLIQAGYGLRPEKSEQVAQSIQLGLSYLLGGGLKTAGGLGEAALIPEAEGLTLKGQPGLFKPPQAITPEALAEGSLAASGKVADAIAAGSKSAFNFGKKWTGMEFLWDVLPDISGLITHPLTGPLIKGVKAVASTAAAKAINVLGTVSGAVLGAAARNEYDGNPLWYQLAGRSTRELYKGAVGAVPYAALSTQDVPEEQRTEQFFQTVGSLAALHALGRAPQIGLGALQGDVGDSLFVRRGSTANSPVPDIAYGVDPFTGLPDTRLDSASASLAAGLNRSQKGLYTRVKQMFNGQTDIYLASPAELATQRANFYGGAPDFTQTPRGLAVPPQLTGTGRAAIFVDPAHFDSTFLHEAVGHPAYWMLPEDMRPGLIDLIKQKNDPAAFTTRYSNGQLDYNSLPTTEEVNSGAKPEHPSGYTKDLIDQEMAAEQIGQFFNGKKIDDWTKDDGAIRRMKNYVGKVMEKYGIPSTTFEADSQALGLQPSVTSYIMMRDWLRQMASGQPMEMVPPRRGVPPAPWPPPGEPGIADADIEKRAYDISQRRQASGTPGDPVSDWLQAEQELIQERDQGKPGAAPPTPGPTQPTGEAPPKGGQPPPARDPQLRTNAIQALQALKIPKGEAGKLVDAVPGETEADIIKNALHRREEAKQGRVWPPPPGQQQPPPAPGPEPGQPLRTPPGAQPQPQPGAQQPPPAPGAQQPQQPTEEEQEELQAKARQMVKEQEGLDMGPAIAQAKGEQPQTLEQKGPPPTPPALMPGKPSAAPTRAGAPAAPTVPAAPGAQQKPEDPMALEKAAIDLKTGNLDDPAVIARAKAVYGYRAGGAAAAGPTVARPTGRVVVGNRLHGITTSFGLNYDGSIDRQDNGRGFFGGVNTRNPHLKATAVPVDVLQKIFGPFAKLNAQGTYDQLNTPEAKAAIKAIRSAHIEIADAQGNIHKFPIVDIQGSLKYHPNKVLDMTPAAAREMGWADNHAVNYQIVGGDGKPYPIPEIDTAVEAAKVAKAEKSFGGGALMPTPPSAPSQSWAQVGQPRPPVAPSLPEQPPAYPTPAADLEENVYGPQAAYLMAQQRAMGLPAMPSMAPSAPAPVSFMARGAGAPAAPGGFSVGFMPGRRRTIGGIEPEPEEGEEEEQPTESTVGLPNPKGMDKLLSLLKPKTLATALKAHAQLLSKDDPRVQKSPEPPYRTKGEHFVPGDPVHESLLNGLPGGQTGRQNQLLGAGQQAIANHSLMHLSYLSAPKEAAQFPNRETRTIQYAANSPEARLMGSTTAQLVGHSMIPVAVGIYPSKEEGVAHQGYIQGISANVLANNAQHTNAKLAQMGQATPYPKIGNKFYNDLEGYLQNLAAGHRGTGDAYAPGTAAYPSTPNRAYVPHYLTKRETDFLNTVINNRGAFAKKAGAVRELAKAGGTLLTEAGETNAMRHAIEQQHPKWSEEVLEPTVRDFSTGLIHELHASPETMPATIRPGLAYKEVAESLHRGTRAGRPDIPVSVAFMPSAGYVSPNVEQGTKIGAALQQLSSPAHQAARNFYQRVEDASRVGGKQGGKVSPALGNWEGTAEGSALIHDPDDALQEMRVKNAIRGIHSGQLSTASFEFHPEGADRLYDIDFPRADHTEADRLITGHNFPGNTIYTGPDGTLRAQIIDPGGEGRERAIALARAAGSQSPIYHTGTAAFDGRPEGTRPEAVQTYRQLLGASGIQTREGERGPGAGEYPAGGQHPLQALYEEAEDNFQRLAREHGWGPAFMPMAGPLATGFAQAKAEGRVFQTPVPQPPTERWTHPPRERFEISDRDMNFKLAPADSPHVTMLEHQYYKDPRGNGMMKLSAAINHPELFENYPHLKKTNISYDPTIGSLGFYQHPWTDPNGVERGNQIVLQNANDRNTLAHEIQHAVQYHEGFPPGANVRAAYAALKGNPEVMEELRKTALENIPTMSLEEYISKRGFHPRTPKEELSEMYSGYQDNLSHRRENWMDDRLHDMAKAVYNRDPGEIEARAVGTRTLPGFSTEHPEITLRSEKELAESQYPLPPAAERLVTAAFMPAAPRPISKATKRKLGPRPDDPIQGQLWDKVAARLDSQIPEAIPLEPDRKDNGDFKFTKTGDPANPKYNPKYKQTEYAIANSPMLQQMGKALGTVINKKTGKPGLAKAPEDVQDDLEELDPEKRLIPYLNPTDRLRVAHLNDISAVDAYAEKLYQMYKGIEHLPEVMNGKDWYDDVVKLLEQHFGKHANLVANLLGATSAGNKVKINYNMAMDAYHQFLRGAFDRHIDLYRKAYAIKQSGKGALIQHIKDQGIHNALGEAEPDTDEAAMEQYIAHHKITPKGAMGKLFGHNSIAALKVLSHTWEKEAGGPKTPNFAANLSGRSLQATIDMWAARTMRRLGYEGYTNKPWLIQPAGEPGVNDVDFGLSQLAFRKAAERIGIKPSSLQAILWFAEQKHWQANKWERAQDAEDRDYRPMLREYKRPEDIPASAYERELHAGPPEAPGIAA